MKRPQHINVATRHRMIGFLKDYFNQETYIRWCDKLEVAVCVIQNRLRQLDRLPLQTMVKTVASEANESGRPATLLALGMLLREHGITLSEGDMLCGEEYMSALRQLHAVIVWRDVPTHMVE